MSDKANNDDDKTIVLSETTLPPSQLPAEPSPQQHNFLQVGTMLGEFEIIGLVGEGGFGIVYLAQDHSLQRKVALKEYMPASLASRGSDSYVSVRSERHRETFEIGRRSFVNEAHLLAQFDHPALVKVYRFWEANGTAYMAMPFYEGKTLRDALFERSTPPDEAWIKKILAPVIDSLELIHKENCYHRDIAPDNIMLLRGDRPVLLDFGAARRVISDMTQALTVILKPGYAPIEQYAEMPGMRQGPWTDVYALAAVVYFMIAGRTPPPAVGRMMQDSYKPLAVEAAGQFSEDFLRGIDKSLGVRANDRPQSMAEMRELLGMSGRSTLISRPRPAQPVTPPAVAPKPVKIAKPEKPKKPEKVRPQPTPKSDTATAGNKRGALIAGASLIVAGGIATALLLPDKHAGQTTIPPSLAAAKPEKAPEPTPPAVAPPKTAIPQPAPAASAPSTSVQSSLAASSAARPVISSLTQAIQTVVAGADPKITLKLDTPRTVTLGSDTLRLSLSSNTAGHLYLFLWDKAEDKLYRLFPNDTDTDNSLSAGKTFSVPRTQLTTPWAYAARTPQGDWQVLAVVSERERSFATAGTGKEAGMPVTIRSALEARFTHGASYEALIGDAVCKTGEACTDHYGASTATISEVAPPPPPEPKPEPAKPVRPAKKEATVKTPPEPKPAKPAKRGTSPEAEREYLRKLNQGLDSLVQP
ncbi:MAG: serine/threonine protein kinase [Rhodocyclales bacterium]|nr:serine/threonine protein kinase [Rhodocyclales bacterium]